MSSSAGGSLAARSLLSPNLPIWQGPGGGIALDRSLGPAGRLFSPNLPIWQGPGGGIALDRFLGSSGLTGPPARIPVARCVQRARRRQGSPWPTGGGVHRARLEPQRRRQALHRKPLREKAAAGKRGARVGVGMVCLKGGARRSNRGFLLAITGIIASKNQFRSNFVPHECTTG